MRPALTAWCLRDAGVERWSLDTICREAKALGIPGVESVEEPDFPLLREYGLEGALTPAHGFVRGMNNPLHWDECLAGLRNAIDANARAGFQNVVTFTGFADTSGPEKGSLVDYETGMKNCVEGYQRIVGHAESHGVTLCLESLNTRDSADMKGHPGYQGDHLDFCVEVINRVGSPALKLLLDVYHVQIMDGDLVRRILDLGDLIGHVQVAGVPGRGELDRNQEINYPAVMRALKAVGFSGFVGLEFIPTRDPKLGIVEALDVLGFASAIV